MVGHEREITVMFSDVRNFTNISESMPSAKVLIEFLNEYMDPMTEIIIESEGTVDKFIGDAIMAYWNAPIDVKNHADKAVFSVMKQLHECIPLNERIKKDPRFTATVKMAAGMGKEPIEVGMGLNTGIAVVGEMGSKGRSDYTVIGDPINLGARLESLCKFYNSQCNISNFTKERLDESKYIFRFLDLVTVKGKSEPIEIWQVHDLKNGLNGEFLFKVSKDRIDEELKLYHHAIQLYKEAKFEEALSIFQEVNSWKDKTNKAVYPMYIERCQHYIEFPPENFNGVFQHTTKG
jgi:adenylate cyclase